jgi:hypothetical protein
MRSIAFVIIAFLLYSCERQVKPEDLGNLDGYWEIEMVVFPSGDRKGYEMNATVDYIETSGMSGYRKKVQPLPDGSFVTSDDAENFLISKRNNTYYMVYSNAMSTWEEEIESLTPERLSVINQNQIRYIYKRYQPLILEEDGP